MVSAAAVTQFTSQHFAGPLGLTALAALIPLIIFYLVKPKPEEQIMPSMMFFMEKKESGTVSQAIQSLVRNLLLLLHILLVMGLAAAIAQPMVSGLNQPEDTVVVFDRSASMEDDLQNAKDFTASNLGRKNTLIVADTSVTVALEDATAAEIRGYIQDLETRDVETDIVTALETVPEYEGKVLLASDLAQTSSSQSAEEAVENLRNDRDVKIMDTSQNNKWGIIDVRPQREETQIEVKNFQETDTEVTLQTPDGSRDLSIEAGEVEPVKVSTDPGITTVSLEEDGMEADNSAYISIPETETQEVLFIADEENEYFKEAVEVIPNADYSYRRPPIEDLPDSDIYVVGKSSRILEGTAKDIQSQVRDGRALILFGQPSLKSKGFSSSPAELGPRLNKTVEVTQPLKANVGNTEIYEATNVKGTSYSNPRTAMLKRNLGDGSVFLYNIQDEDFRFDFLYPVFWKRLFNDMTETPTIGEFNLRTGKTVNGTRLTSTSGEEFDSEITAFQAGFYNSSAATYAVNMESERESGSEPLQIEGSQSLQTDSKQNVQNLAATVLAVLVLLEMFYLMWIGEV